MDLTVYKWYVYQNGQITQYFDFIQDAAKALKEIQSEHYSALGIEKDGLSCDLVFKESGIYEISQDHLKSSFKDDAYIVEKTINLLYDTFVERQSKEITPKLGQRVEVKHNNKVSNDYWGFKGKIVTMQQALARKRIKGDVQFTGEIEKTFQIEFDRRDKKFFDLYYENKVCKSLWITLECFKVIEEKEGE